MSDIKAATGLTSVKRGAQHDPIPKQPSHMRISQENPES
jgi:hypothetical protein